MSNSRECCQQISGKQFAFKPVANSCIEIIPPVLSAALENAKQKKFAGSHRALVMTTASMFDLAWPQNATVCIKFLNGEIEQQRLVYQTIRRTYEPLMNLKLVWLDAGTESERAEKEKICKSKTPGYPDIRVGFNWNGDAGSWSTLGTQSWNGADKISMNFGWLDDAVIKHEFGHALMAAIHEQSVNKGNPIKWNCRAVAQALSGPPNNWNTDQICINMFNRYDESTLLSTQFDAKSIMLYVLPEEYFANPEEYSNRPRLPISILSQSDKVLLQCLYPKSKTLYDNPNDAGTLLPMDTTQLPDDLRVLAKQKGFAGIPGPNALNPDSNSSTEQPDATSSDPTKTVVKQKTVTRTDQHQTLVISLSVVGGVIGALLIAALIVFLAKKHKKQTSLRK